VSAASIPNERLDADRQARWAALTSANAPSARLLGPLVFTEAANALTTGIRPLATIALVTSCSQGSKHAFVC